MNEFYNLYIDESCHLENDHFPIMCIGYVKIEQRNYLRFKDGIKKIKLRHKTPTEIKWQKVSLSRVPLYKELIDFFFANPIDFRCVLIKNKEKLDHKRYNRGDHNSFYYKTVYLLLNSYTNPKSDRYKVLLDIKDTRGRERLNHIEEIFKTQYNGNSPFIFFQHISSHENELLQIADLFIGAISYKARKADKAEDSSVAKQVIIEYLENKSGYSLDEGTEPWESKFNIFDFQPRSNS